MKKKKVLIIILLIVLILIGIFLACTIRKMVIVKSLKQKVSQYKNSNNYYERITNNLGNTMEYYCKNGNSVLFYNSGEDRKITTYTKDGKTNTYIEMNGSKIANLDSNDLMNKINIIEIQVADDNLLQLFLSSIALSIKDGEYKGKDCYIYSLGESNEVYIEKETGLRIKANDVILTNVKNENDEKLEVEYYYEFDNVEDTIFVEPDISMYTIQQDD